MKATELAIKKLDQLCGQEHARRELQFAGNFLFTGFPPSLGRHSLFLKDIPLFAGRCLDYEISIIGFELNQDSEYQFRVFTWEEYFSSYYNDWINLAVDDMRRAGILKDIIPTIDIPLYVLNRYMIT